ncbi:MAG: hypothetical protein U0572_18135 [Phycisphaerales bacterium]
MVDRADDERASGNGDTAAEAVHGCTTAGCDLALFVSHDSHQYEQSHRAAIDGTRAVSDGGADGNAVDIDRDGTPEIV